MQVRISKPTKSAIQSGPGDTSWLLEFVNHKPNCREKENLMGRTSSSDMSNEVKLFFPTLQDAIDFAERKYYSYEIIPVKKSSIHNKSYADNFC